MNHEITLSLGLIQAAEWGYRFEMTVLNRSSVKLLLPPPEIHGLRFGNKKTMQEAEWFTTILVSAAMGGIFLPPNESSRIDWWVRPHEVEQPEEMDRFDYHRWCVELWPGEYLVWYRWKVDGNYFDPDSHARLPDLSRIAAEEGATVWLGEAISNRLHVVRTIWGN